MVTRSFPPLGGGTGSNKGCVTLITSMVIITLSPPRRCVRNTLPLNIKRERKTAAVVQVTPLYLSDKCEQMVLIFITAALKKAHHQKNKTGQGSNLLPCSLAAQQQMSEGSRAS